MSNNNAASPGTVITLTASATYIGLTAATSTFVSITLSISTAFSAGMISSFVSLFTAVKIVTTSDASNKSNISAPFESSISFIISAAFSRLIILSPASFFPVNISTIVDESKVSSKSAASTADILAIISINPTGISATVVSSGILFIWPISILILGDKSNITVVVGSSIHPS